MPGLIYKLIFFSLTFFFVASSQELAASSDFRVNLFIGEDVTPPTVPVITAVMPVASSQIDVSWSSSIDDVILSGYVVYRNGTAVATTTLTNFSDTLLLENTLYTYTVTAFDNSGNVSAQSVGISTTTLTNLVEESPVRAVQSGSSVVGLQSFNIEVGNNLATLQWSTFGVTNYSVSWGKTPSYELGSLSSNIFALNHYTTITQLEPNTKYWYKVYGVNPRGLSRIIKEDYFSTTGVEVANNIGNVSLFSTKAEENNIRLFWENNFAYDDEYVRIVRSNLFYPADIQAGSVVYEGRGNTFLDKDALVGVSGQYYTIFVRDKDGNVSSGAVAFAQKNTGGKTEPVETAGVGVDIDIGATPVLIPDTGDENILRAVQIEIVQNKYHDNLASKIFLETGQNYTVSIPVNAVTKNLKTIIVSVQDPSDQRQVSAYLLKLNKEGTFYSTVVTAPDTVGEARLTVELFDYSKQSVRRISAVVTFRESSTAVKDWYLIPAKYRLLWLIPGLGSLLFLLLVFRFRTEDKP